MMKATNAARAMLRRMAVSKARVVESAKRVDSRPCAL